MAEEIFDIVDENGHPTGETVTRSKAREEEDERCRMFDDDDELW